MFNEAFWHFDIFPIYVEVCFCNFMFLLLQLLVLIFSIYDWVDYSNEKSYELTDVHT